MTIIHQCVTCKEAWPLSNTSNNAPFIDKKVKGKSSPWLNGNIKREMNERDKLLRNARKSNSDLDWSAYK